MHLPRGQRSQCCATGAFLGPEEVSGRSRREQEEPAGLVPMPGARKRPNGARPGTFLQVLGCGPQRNFLEQQHCRAGEAAPRPPSPAGALPPNPVKPEDGVLAEATLQGSLQIR